MVVLGKTAAPYQQTHGDYLKLWSFWTKIRPSVRAVLIPGSRCSHQDAPLLPLQMFTKRTHSRDTAGGSRGLRLRVTALLVVAMLALPALAAAQSNSPT